LDLLNVFIDDYQQHIMAGWGHINWNSALPTKTFEDAFIGCYAAAWIANVAAMKP
tara:strand:+ start:80 stop:244 length:165 start_codon:yes stop_codon:yes gene_type:complete